MAFEGRLVSPTAYAEAIAPGMHGMVYEGIFRDMYLLPNHDHGRVVSHDPETQTVMLQLYRTKQTTHWPEAAPILKAVRYDDATQFFIEDAPASLEDTLHTAGSFVQVRRAHPVGHG